MFSKRTKPGVVDRFILCAVILLTLTVSISVYGQVTRQSAEDLVLQEVLAEQIGEVDIYILNESVPKDSGLSLWRKDLSVPYDENWVFFVDEVPFANWEHQCSYIFVNKETGKYEIVEETIHPDNFDEYEMISGVERPDNAGKVYKSSPSAKIQSVDENDHLYAVIINGYDWQRYWNDISALYCTLIDVYGYPEENIFIQYVEGSSTFGSDFNDDGTNDIDYDAYKSSIEQTFRNLSGEWTNDSNVPELGPEDQLLIFTDDHGGHDGSSSYLCLPDDDLYPDELADYIEDINCASMVIVMEQCHSGGFESDLASVTNAACKHRVIKTACAEDESSWAEIWISNAQYDEFIFYWTAAMRGYYPDPTGAEPWETSSATGSFPFSSYFSSHPSDYDPDSNGDGKIQMEEAFEYTDDFDSWSPNGFYDRYYAYDENPVINNMSGFEDDLLDLTGISGDVSQSQTVEGNFLVSGDLNISDGVTLTVEPGTQFTFDNGSSLVIGYYSLLTASGTLSNPIIFDFVASNSTTQNGIKIDDASMATINYCKIYNAYRGIYEHSFSIDVRYSLIKDCYHGLYLYNSSPTIRQCRFENNVYSGIYMVNSSPYLYNNYMINNYYGVYCTSSSEPNFGYGSTYGENGITNNYCGVYCKNNSYPMLGQSSPVNGGYNNLVNAAYNIYNASSGTVYAHHNWWGSTTPASFGIGGSGTTSYTNYLSSSVTIDPTPPLYKSSYDVFASNTDNISMISELDKAYELIASNELEEARDICLNLVNNYPDHSVSYNALNLLKETFTAEETASRIEVYESLFNQNEKKDIHATAGLILANLDDGNKLQRIEEVINNSTSENVEEIALFDKLIYYYFEMEDEEKALAVCNELDNRYPGTHDSYEAHRILGDDEYYTNEKYLGLDASDKEVVEDDTVSITGDALLDNYPNPFNPTTTIEYSLTNSANVSLKVYDMLGREVITLVDKAQLPGNYEVRLNASKLASGIYFYKLQAGDFRAVKKMILLK